MSKEQDPAQDAQYHLQIDEEKPEPLAAANNETKVAFTSPVADSISTTAEPTPNNSPNGGPSPAISPATSPENSEEVHVFPLLMYSKLALIFFANSFVITMLFPFVAFMVRDFGIADNEKEIGHFAGFLSASFMVGRFLSSTFWGWFSDRHGRKPVFYIGIVSLVILTSLFGLVQNYYLAVTIRFFTGLLNGIMTAGKAYAAELVHPSLSPKAMSVMSTSWGLGLILGPAAGGVLAQPAEKYPSVFSTTGLFGIYPYLLPCLVCCACSSIGLFFLPGLPETVRKADRRYRDDVQNGVEAASPLLVESAAKKQAKKSRCCCSWQSIRNSKYGIVMSEPKVFMTVSIYGLWSLVSIFVDEVYPLWAVTSIGLGGLGFTSSGVGITLAFTGLAIMIFQFLVYHRIAKKYSIMRIFQFGTLLAVPAIAAIPFTGSLSGVGPQGVLWAAVIISIVTKHVCNTITNTSVFILINNSTTKQYRGFVNGTGVALGSLCKAIGPAVGGSLFSWSLKVDTFPVDYHFAFFVAAFLTTLPLIISYFLPESINRPLEEKQDAKCKLELCAAKQEQGAKAETEAK